MGLIKTNQVLKNYIINGNFDFWQRGTSFSSAAGSPYTADRWWFHGASTNTTIAQVTTSLDLGMQYACSLKFTSASSSTHYFPTPLDGNTVRALQGKTVTLSVRYKNILNASAPWAMAIQYSTTENQKDPGTALASVSLTNSASWTTAQVTFVVPSAALSLQIRMQNESNTVNNAEIHFGKVMLNEGSVAAPFQTAGANIAAELDTCLRYYERIGDKAASSIQCFGYGGVSVSVTLQVLFGAKKRTIPTVTVVGTWSVINCNQPTASASSHDGTIIGATTTAVAGFGFYNASHTTAYITADAELV